MTDSTIRPAHYFLTREESEFFDVFCSLIVPSGQDPKNEPGAREVGAVNYIDSNLFSFPKEVQDYFRSAIKLLRDLSKERFAKDFVGLSDSDKNLVLRELLLNPKTREMVFDLRSLALEGFYSDYHDPWYVGSTAWQFVQFGGKRISDMKKDWTFLKIWKDWEETKGKAGQ